MSLFAAREAQVDSSLVGSYVASPVKFMIYGRGKLLLINVPSDSAN